jgi:hypothetical protein
MARYLVELEQRTAFVFPRPIFVECLPHTEGLSTSCARMGRLNWKVLYLKATPLSVSLRQRYKRMTQLVTRNKRDFREVKDADNFTLFARLPENPKGWTSLGDLQHFTYDEE